jgi:hypothetical protein
VDGKNVVKVTLFDGNVHNGLLISRNPIDATPFS